MMSQFRYIFVIFYFTAILILTVYLRSVNNRIFYKLCTLKDEQSKLTMELGAKQLQLENLINPSAVSERLGD